MSGTREEDAVGVVVGLRPNGSLVVDTGLMIRVRQK